MERQFSRLQALAIGERIGLDFKQIDLEQFRIGLAVELEHGLRDRQTNITDDDMEMTGKIAWQHLKELPDYYTRLDKMEKK